LRFIVGADGMDIAEMVFAAAGAAPVADISRTAGIGLVIGRTLGDGRAATGG